MEVARKPPGRRIQPRESTAKRRRKRHSRRESAQETRRGPAGNRPRARGNRPVNQNLCEKIEKESQESSSRNRGHANQFCDPGVERTMWPLVHLMNMTARERRFLVLCRYDAPNSFLSFVRLTSHAFDRTRFAAPRLVEICGIRESPVLGSALLHSNTASSICRCLRRRID